MKLTPLYQETAFTSMFYKIVMTNSRTKECALGIAPVFAALGPLICWPNTANLFAYSKRKVLFAT